MKRFLLTAAFVLAVAPALAAHWNVDTAKSKLGFTVNWSGEPFVATFHTWKANIDFDPADPAHAHVLASIDLASEASDTQDNDDGLKGPQGFDAAKFPSAQFEAKGFKPLGHGKYLANGKLTLHGVTRSVPLTFTLAINGNSARATGTAPLMRTDFGIGQGEWASATTIAHEVTVNLDLVAVKAH
jgi:polyisoprenoid-binding protein YceI